MKAFKFLRNSYREEPINKNGHTPEDVGHKDKNMHNILNIKNKGNKIFLDERIAAAKKNIITEELYLTPELASELLSRNPENRKLSERIVAKYARDMAAGNWVMNGETIIVSSDGLLNDGQHRCAAVVQSGVPIKTVVVFGTDRASRLTVDQGKMRQASDYLGMEGFHNATTLATTAAYVWQYEKYGFLGNSQSQKPTKTEILYLIQDHPELISIVDKLSYKSRAVFGSAGLSAFLYYTLTRKAPVEAVDQFFDQICEGIGLQQNSPTLYARNRLLKLKGIRIANQKAELLIRSWNAFRKGRLVKTLPVIDGPLPKIEV